MDRQWIKNLAQSSYGEGQWQLSDPNSPSLIAVEKLQTSLEELYDVVKGNIDIFNMHAPEYKQLKLFRLSHHAGGKSYGFLIMLGRLQMQVEQQGANFRTTGVLIQQPKPIHIPMRLFDARHDTFGDVFWVMDGKITLNIERLSKQMLEDICRFAYESGILQRHAPIVG